MLLNVIKAHDFVSSLLLSYTVALFFVATTGDFFGIAIQNNLFIDDETDKEHVALCTFLIFTLFYLIVTTHSYRQIVTQNK